MVDFIIITPGLKIHSVTDTTYLLALKLNFTAGFVKNYIQFNTTDYQTLRKVQKLLRSRAFSNLNGTKKTYYVN